MTVHLAAPGAGPVGAAAPAPVSDPATPYLPSPPMTPASVSTHLADEASITGVAATGATADVQGIPAPALAAYQRAETVINAADQTCNLSWQLLAAIGDVESHHGRFGVSQLGSDGLASPSIIGIPLNGTGGTALVKDTDAGLLDGDQQFDRAVGPMQFIPSTWSVVGVDADDDGERNPQDIDDAALAAAVYLCSGDDDLSTPSGQVVAVNRYNHSAAYVERVLSLMQQYLAGGYGTSPVGTTPLVPTTSTVAAGRIDELHPDPSGSGGSLTPPRATPRDPDWQPGSGGNTPPDTDIEQPTDPTDPTDPTEEPTEEPTTPPPLVVVKLPAVPGVDDPCGGANAEWIQPQNVKPFSWSLVDGRLVVTITDDSVFDKTTKARSHDYGAAVETVVECQIPSDATGLHWPGGLEAPWVPGEQGGVYSLAEADARCAKEGFEPGRFEFATCQAYYVVPRTPGAPQPGDWWS